MKGITSGQEYDYIFAGGGAAGLSLALALRRNLTHAPTMLIIDRDRKEHNDRTWCFWTDHPTPYDHLVYHRWDQAEFISPTFRRRYDLAPYQYQMIRGIDFYEAARSELAGDRVDFLQARVEEVQDSRTAAQVLTDRRSYMGRWVFDSTFTPKDYFRGPAGYHYLKQHFKGWEVETPDDRFEPNVATLFDFRTPQKGAMRFFYVLPFDRRHALVEYTLFSSQLLKPHEYDRAIAEYLETTLGIPKYRTTATETGIIPMTDMPFTRRLGSRVMAIGTKGGQVKPSSGYAFLRILADAEAVALSLEKNGQPFDARASTWRYRLFDAIMLDVMDRHGGRMADIFTALFRKNSIQHIFRFLDESASPLEDLRLIASLPPGPFVQGLLKVGTRWKGSGVSRTKSTVG